MTETYRNYKITPGGLGYEYVHEDYEGVFEYGGEDMSPTEYDHRAGSCKTIEQCKAEIDELDDDLSDKLEAERDKERERKGITVPDENYDV